MFGLVTVVSFCVFKLKTAYEMRISDCSSDVCSSDLALREGGCDLMLAFYDPDSAMQMDPEIFPSLHLGQTEMLPVCAADADGKPLFDLEGRSEGASCRERVCQYG